MGTTSRLHAPRITYLSTTQHNNTHSIEIHDFSLKPTPPPIPIIVLAEQKK